MRLTAIFKVYKICILLHRCNLKISLPQAKAQAAAVAGGGPRLGSLLGRAAGALPPLLPLGGHARHPNDAVLLFLGERLGRAGRAKLRAS